MTIITPPPPRIATLDILRGVAVMGILVMNIVDFGSPQQAMLTPHWRGQASGTDLWAWTLSFIFVEGKMRGLFSLLFGASMLLVIERAEAAGLSGETVHKRRMAWLLLFGLAHFFLVWRGDILSHYAVVGMVAYLLHDQEPRALFKLALAMFLLDFILAALIFGSPVLLQLAAAAPGADADTLRQSQEVAAAMASAPSDIAKDIALHQGSYWRIVRHQLGNWYEPVAQVILFGPETLGLMLLGMWGLKRGFLSGEWTKARYSKVAMIGFAVAIPAYALLALGVRQMAYAPSATLAASLVGGAVFRPIMTLAYAALIILLAARSQDGAIARRIGAAGRAAFTNYLGTSIAATFIFYGWGLGLYGTMDRLQLYLAAGALCVVMLLWSKPWLDRYRYGPFEWLWRSLARGAPQPMRRGAAS
jgi:uncharacterized protein